MRLLNNEEMQTIRNEIIRYVDLGSNTGMQALSRDTAKAQQELTNREWVEWVKQQHKWQGTNGETGEPFSKGWIVPISEWQARLKEIEDATQV